MLPWVRIPPSPNWITKVEDSSYKDSVDNNDRRSTFAVFSYLIPLIGWVIPLYLKKENKFCQFHAKQGFFLAVICVIIALLLNFINIFVPRDWRILRFVIVFAIYGVYIFYPLVCFAGIYASMRGRIFEITLIRRFMRLIEL